MCVYPYIYPYIYIPVYIYACVPVYIPAYISVYIYMRVCVIRVNTVHICMYAEHVHIQRHVDDQ